VVTLVLGATVARVITRHRKDKFLTRPALFAATLLLVQLSLGIAAYIVRARSPFDPQPLTPMVAVTVAHVACGALVFASTIVLALRIFRVVSAEQKNYALATA
jgi:heme A synthase